MSYFKAVAIGLVGLAGGALYMIKVQENNELIAQNRELRRLYLTEIKRVQDREDVIRERNSQIKELKKNK